MSPPFGWKPERFCSKRRPSGNNPFSALKCCIEATAIPSIPGNSWVSWVSVVHLDIPPWRDGYQRLVVRRWKSQWGRYPLSCRRFRGGRAWGGGSWQGWGDGWGGKVPEIFFFKSLPSERLGSKLWLNCELYVYMDVCYVSFGRFPRSISLGISLRGHNPYGFFKTFRSEFILCFRRFEHGSQ